MADYSYKHMRKSWWIILSIALAFGCTRTPPTPESEPDRSPTFIIQALTVPEAGKLSADLLTAMPDSPFAQDRLNPDRLAAQDLKFSCVAGCPEGMTVDPVTGELNWSPSYLDAGVHFVTYRVESGLLVTEETVPVVVTDVDRPPEFVTQQTSVQGREMELARVPLLAEDPDGDPVSYRCVENCPAGSRVQGGEFLWFPSYADAGERVIKIAAESQPIDREIVISGLAEEDDSPAFRQEAERASIDRQGVLSAKIDITFEIENVNQPILVYPMTPVSTFESLPLLAQIEAEDPDGDAITYSCVQACPEGLEVDERTGVVSWTPSFDQAGDYQIGIEASAGPDDRGLIIFPVEVLNTNRAPYFYQTIEPVLAKEGQEVSFVIPVQDDDREDSLLMRCISGCPDGLSIISPSGLVSWTPSYDASGEYQLVLGASDGRVEIAISAGITVEHVNRPPVWTSLPALHETNAMQALDLRLKAEDPDREDVGKLRYTCEQCPDGLTIVPNTGQLRWFPDWSDNGLHEIIVTVTDGTVVVAGATRIKVNRLDRPPRFEDLKPDTGIELSEYRVQATAVDPDGDQIRYSCESGCGEKITIDPTTGLIYFLPGYKDSGQYSLLIRASSNPVWDTDLNETKYSDIKVDFFIRNNNRAPLLEPVQSSFELFEGDHPYDDDESPKGDGALLTLRAEDPDEDPISYVCLDNCPPGLSVDVVTGEVSWVPGYDAALPGGTEYKDIRFAVLDGEAVVKTDPISILVKNVNRPPVISSPSDLEVYEEGHRTEKESSSKTLPVSFLIPAVDPDGDALSFACVAGCPPELTVDAQSGKVDWTPSYQEILYPETEKVYSGVVYQVSDGMETFYTDPHQITVKNVNRAPVFAAISSHQIVFEQGHRTSAECPEPTDYCPEFQDKPLHLDLGAIDPDGEPISYRCVSGCPDGLTLNEATGEVFWRPLYLPESGNGAALPNNAPRSNIQFAVSDPHGEVLATPMTITVKNVDRSPRLRSLGTVSVTEQTEKSFIMDVYDPDGDPVETTCHQVTVSPDSARYEFSRPLTSCSDGYYPGFSPYGYTKWLTVDRDTAEVTLTPGWFEALKDNPEIQGDDVYTVTYRLRSNPEGFLGAPAISRDVSHPIRVVNKDRPTPLSPPSDPIGVVENQLLQFGLFFDEDPDREFGEYLDVATYSCVEEVDESGVRIGPCPEDPNADRGTSEHTLKVDQVTGLVSWTPSFLHAKYADLESGEERVYRLKFRVSSAPDGFSTAPLDTDGVWQIRVINNDRPAEFIVGADPATIHLWEPDAAVEGNKPVLTEALKAAFGDSPAELPTSASAPAGAKDPDHVTGHLTETAVSFVVQGCSLEKNTKIEELAPCPEFISYDEEAEVIRFSPPSFDDALPFEAPRYVVVTASSCPLPETGWRCGAPFFNQDPESGVNDFRNDAKPRIDIPVKVYNVDRPASLTLAEGQLTEDGTLMMLETEDNQVSLSWDDPDGSPVRFCIERTDNDAFEKPLDGAQSIFTLNSSAGDGAVGEEIGDYACFSSGDLAATGEAVLRINPGINPEPYEFVKRGSGSRTEQTDPGEVITLAENMYQDVLRQGERVFGIKIRALSSDTRYNHSDKPITDLDLESIKILNDDRPTQITVDVSSDYPAPNVGDATGVYEVRSSSTGEYLPEAGVESVIKFEVSIVDPDPEDHLNLSAFIKEPEAVSSDLIQIQPEDRGPPITFIKEEPGSYNHATFNPEYAPTIKTYTFHTSVHGAKNTSVEVSKEIAFHNVIRPPKISGVLSQYGSISSTYETAPAPVTFTSENPEATGGLPSLVVSDLSVGSPLSNFSLSNITTSASQISFPGNRKYLSTCVGCSYYNKACPSVSFKLCYKDAPGICTPAQQTKTCFRNNFAGVSWYVQSDGDPNRYTNVIKKTDDDNEVINVVVSSSDPDATRINPKITHWGIDYDLHPRYENGYRVPYDSSRNYFSAVDWNKMFGCSSRVRMNNYDLCPRADGGYYYDDSTSSGWRDNTGGTKAWLADNGAAVGKIFNLQGSGVARRYCYSYPKASGSYIQYAFQNPLTGAYLEPSWIYESTALKRKKYNEWPWNLSQGQKTGNYGHGIRVYVKVTIQQIDGVTYDIPVQTKYFRTCYLNI